MSANATETGQSAGNDQQDKSKDEDQDPADQGQQGQDSSGDENAAGSETPEADELAKVKRRMQAADQRAAAAEAKLKQIEDAEKTELQKAQDDLKTSQAETAKLREELAQQRLDNAFLTSTDASIVWQNPAAALRFAQAQGYLDEVANDDGTIDDKALKAALNKMAKEHEYLVKKSTQQQTGDAGPEGRQKDEEARKAALRARFPVLGRR